MRFAFMTSCAPLSLQLVKGIGRVPLVLVAAVGRIPILLIQTHEQHWCAEWYTEVVKVFVLVLSSQTACKSAHVASLRCSA